MAPSRHGRGHADLPLGRGSIALGLHLSAGDAVSAVDTLCRQAVAAEQYGFDGVSLSEHHGGFPSYVPTPTMLVARLLAVTERVWAAPCPTILPLRHRVSVVEDLAWLAAAYPSRVGAGFVSGYHQRDYEIFGAGVRFDTRLAEYASAVEWVTAALRGEVEGPLAGDPAIAALSDRPVPVVIGVGGRRGISRAARAGAGLLLRSQTVPDDLRAQVQAYREEGGRAPCLLVRRLWVGEPPASLAEQLASYAEADVGGALTHKSVAEVIVHGDPATVAARLSHDWSRGNVDGLNLRVFAPDAAPEALLQQIEVVGREVLPVVRRELEGGTAAD